MRVRTLAFLLLLLSLLATPASAAQAAPRCFPEVPAIVDCIDDRIRTFWEQQGGLPAFGYPLSAPYQNQTNTSVLTMQRFERQRLELHPENRPPYDVLLGRLGVEVLERRGRDWTTFPKGDPAAAHYFPETGHAIGSEFWDYWSSHGLEFDGRPGASFAESLALFGMPLSEPAPEVNPADGRPYLTQWFERARFEHHPEHAGTPHVVQLGLLERELNDAGGASQAPAFQPAVPASPSGGFVQVSGSQLTLLGQPVQLKGVNYYPQGRPWLEMWNYWEGPQIEQELRLARDQLGINTARVLVPYSATSEGQVTAEQLGQMRELAQIAGNLDLRLIVTLFDFHQEFPPAGSRMEELHLNYLRTLIGNFAGDDRIIAWDLHNEPDNYLTWREGQPGQVLSWLGRMADEVHRLAPNHLVTVGMANVDNLLLPGPDGRRPIDYSDVVSAHIYDMFAVGYQLDLLRLHTAKPIILEEFGWPSEIGCLRRIYNEAHQLRVYRDTLAAAQGRVAGVFAWTLRDYDAGPTRRWDTHEEHYGLYRADGSLKPAADEFRAYGAAPLPSIVSTDLPLTATGPSVSDSDQAPLLVPGSDHYVKGWFRRAWDLLGGQGSFGLPVTEALIVPGSTPTQGRVVQYFEAAVLQYFPAGDRDPKFPMLSEPEKAKRMIIVHDLGAPYAAGRVTIEGGHPVDDHFAPFYRGVHGSWRLGDPISPLLVEEINGAPAMVQYFQRGRLQVNPASQLIEAGPVGRWAWEGRCAAAPE